MSNVERPPTDQPLWNPAIETLSADALRALQQRRQEDALKLERLRVLRREYGRENEPFEIHAISREAFTVDGARRHVLGYLGDFLFTPDRARSPVSGAVCAKVNG